MKTRAPFLSAFIGLYLICLCPLLTMPLLPLTDLPEHVGQAVIWANPNIYGPEATTQNRHSYETQWFTPYLSVLVLTGVLSKIIGPIPAYKTVIALTILLLPLALNQLLKSLHSKPKEPPPDSTKWLSLVGFPLSFGFAFQLGFLNFCLAVPLSLWILSLPTNPTPPTNPLLKQILTALLFLLLFFTHPVALAITLLLYPILSPQRTHIGCYLPLIPVVLLTTFWISTKLTAPTDKTSFSVVDSTHFKRTGNPVVETAIYRATKLLPWLQGSTRDALPQGNILHILLLILACCLSTYHKKKDENLKKPAVPRAMTALILLYLFLPDRIFNIVYVPERLPVYIGAIAICVLPAANPNKLQISLLLSTLLLNLAPLTPLNPKMRELASESHALYRILKKIPADSFVETLGDRGWAKSNPFPSPAGWIITQKAHTNLPFTRTTHLPIQQIPSPSTPSPKYLLTSYKYYKHHGTLIARENQYKLLKPKKKKVEADMQTPP